MSPRRGGWDYAQIRSSFSADPEFQRLRGACRNDRDFLASVGLWAIATAQAWREDCDDASGVLESYPGFPKGPGYLRGADLIREGDTLAGFAKWTETVRRIRSQDAARKSGNQAPPPLDTTGIDDTPPDSDGLPRTPVEFPRGVGVGVVVNDVEIPPKPPSGGLRSKSTNPRSNGDAPRQREAAVKAGLLAALNEIGGVKSMPPGLKGETA